MFFLFDVQSAVGANCAAIKNSGSYLSNIKVKYRAIVWLREAFTRSAVGMNVG